MSIFVEFPSCDLIAFSFQSAYDKTCRHWYRSSLLSQGRIHMKDLEALLREIESARSQLERALLQNDNFEQYYLQSTKMDKLLEEYIEVTTEKMHRRSAY